MPRLVVTILAMSEQGPGGYGGGGYGGGPPPGGGGQGGWGPPPGSPPGAPPGAPPGGYGGPPPGGGGYGQPPGGYGQPPGGPPGWPQQPGYGPPGQPGPPPVAPASKGNPLVWVGLGCGALLLLGGAGASWVYFSIVRPAQEAERAIKAAGGLGASVTVGDGGVVVKLPGIGEVSAPTAPPPANAAPAAPDGPGVAPARPGTPLTPAVPSAGSPSLAAGGPSCVLATACCKSVAAKAGGQAQAVAGCDALSSAPEFACAQALATYRKTASLLGASCP